MYTSYFRKYHSHPNAVSIARSSPDYFSGLEYEKLAPPNWLLQKYHQDHDEKYYTDTYLRIILGSIDPKTVYHELGKDAIMLCWEKTGSFCHRNIVANWLVNNLGIEVTEL